MSAINEKAVKYQGSTKGEWINSQRKVSQLRKWRYARPNVESNFATNLTIPLKDMLLKHPWRALKEAWIEPWACIVGWILLFWLWTCCDFSGWYQPPVVLIYRLAVPYRFFEPQLVIAFDAWPRSLIDEFASIGSRWPSDPADLSSTWPSRSSIAHRYRGDGLFINTRS